LRYFGSLGIHFLHFAPTEKKIQNFELRRTVLLNPNGWVGELMSSVLELKGGMMVEQIINSEIHDFDTEESGSVDENKSQRGRFAGASEPILLSCRSRSELTEVKRRREPSSLALIFVNVSTFLCIKRTSSKPTTSLDTIGTLSTPNSRTSFCLVVCRENGQVLGRQSGGIGRENERSYRSLPEALIDCRF
jgi:hypothetical protein